MITDETNYGKPISKELSEYLRDYASLDDRANVAERMDVKLSTIRNVVYRTNTLTKDNVKAIEELIIIAVHNCEQVIIDAKKAKQYLNSKNK